MWKLWHKLFGWRYVLVRTYSEPLIRRVYKTPKGDSYINHRGIKFLYQIDYSDLTH